MSIETLSQAVAQALPGFAWVGFLVLQAGATICILNALTYPRLPGGCAPSSTNGLPFVSILVPARDEAEVIAVSVRRLLAQEYPGQMELLVLDDGSTDGTMQLAEQAIGADPRGRVIHGQPLPPGWVGKNWACAQLAETARGEVLVFTDADVRWEPPALPALVRQMLHYSADCLSVMPTQQTFTWSERLTVPMIAFLVLGFLPELGIRYARSPIYSSANGQCLAFRRAAYDRTGGHSGVKSSVIEDLSLARRVKQCGLRLVVAQAGPLIRTRMYTSWRDVRHGFGKNILALHGGQPALLALSMAVLAGMLILPFIWLAAGFAPGFNRSPFSSGWPALPAAMIVLALGIRLLSAAVSGARLRDAFLLPASVVLVMLVAAQALWWHYRGGGPKWKGRRIAIE